MSDKVVLEENLDDIIKSIVNNVKKRNGISNQESDRLVSEAIENTKFMSKLNEIRLESPDDRVIFVEGNEELVYDHGEFFMCDPIDSKKQRIKLKRKEATELYVEFFIRYQLNQIIEQKNMQAMSKTIKKIDVSKSPTGKIKVAQKKAEGKVESNQINPSHKRNVKTKDTMVR